jgi:hypothetical protein
MLFITACRGFLPAVTVTAANAEEQLEQILS